MDLYLIRHADAVPLGEGGIHDDSERPLTETGKAQAKALAQAFKRKGIRLDAVLTSPLLRARQTAEEMLKNWPEPRPPIQVSDHLTLGGRRKRLSRDIEELALQSVALVGHQPDLCEYTAWLMGAKKAQVDITKAGVAFIQCPDEIEKGGGTLLWLITPTWFEADSSVPMVTDAAQKRPALSH